MSIEEQIDYELTKLPFVHQNRLESEFERRKRSKEYLDLQSICIRDLAETIFDIYEIVYKFDRELYLRFIKHNK